MLALIRMDWTLNRRILFQYSPFFVLWIAVGVSRGMQSLLGIAFAAAALVMGMTLLQNLRDTVEPFVCALPVSRRQIVLARYLSTLTAMTLSLGFFFLLGWAGHHAGFHWAKGILAGDLAVGVGLQAITLSAGLFLYLPFHFRFGGDLGLGLFIATLMACLITLFVSCGWEGLLDRVLLLLARMLEERSFAVGVLAAWAALGAASLSLSVIAYRRRITRRPLSPALPVLLMLSTFLSLGITAQAASRAAAQEHSRATLDALLAPHFKATEPGAVVLVSREGRVLLRQGYGRAAAEGGASLTPDAIFPIGSLTKQFTAALVLLQMEEGRIEPGKPIRAYVPEVPEAWSQVTVEQCLNHTGGLPNFTSDPGFEAIMARSLSPQQLLETCAKAHPLEFAPGSQFKYSNTGYLLLGMALELVSGQPYGALLQERICRPLGLKHTRFGTDPHPFQGYSERFKPAPAFSLALPYAAGGIVSSLDDLARWSMALHGGKVLKPTSLARMTTPGRTTDGKATHYGFGLVLTEPNGHRILVHGGQIPGFTSYLGTDPEQKTVVAVLFNTNAAPALPLERLMDAACGRERPQPVAISLPESALEAVAGTYELKPGFQLKLWREGRKLMGQGTNQPSVQLYPESPTRFFLKAAEASLEFQLDAQGKAVSLILNQGGNTLPGRRIH